MINDLEKLMREIEILRAQLNCQGNCKGLQDAEVLRKSERLDVLINQYYRLVSGK